MLSLGPSQGMVFLHLCRKGCCFLNFLHLCPTQAQRGRVWKHLTPVKDRFFCISAGKHIRRTYVFLRKRCARCGFSENTYVRRMCFSQVGGVGGRSLLRGNVAYANVFRTWAEFPRSRERPSPPILGNLCLRQLGGKNSTYAPKGINLPLNSSLYLA